MYDKCHFMMRYSGILPLQISHCPPPEHSLLPQARTHPIWEPQQWSQKSFWKQLKRITTQYLFFFFYNNSNCATSMTESIHNIKLTTCIYLEAGVGLNASLLCFNIDFMLILKLFDHTEFSLDKSKSLTDKDLWLAFFNMRVSEGSVGKLKRISHWTSWSYWFLFFY